MFKISFFSLIGALAIFLTANAGPLDRAMVGANAKWVLHLDWEALRASTVGRYVIDKIVKPKIEEAEKNQKLGLSINPENISGLTVYGTSFEKQPDGVLILSTTANVKKDVEKLAGLAALSGNEEIEVTLKQEKPYLLYSLKGGLLLAPDISGKVFLAKSQAQIEAARDVALGKIPNMANKAVFTDYPDVKDSFFFFGMADGFNAREMPPQAKVLRETDGGRLVLGEKGQDLFVNLVFKGKDESASLKIKQVLQGIVALASLSEQNHELTDLASRLNIASEGRNVSVDLRFPTAKAIKTINEKHGIGQEEEETASSAQE